jgi:hypothetical protein
MADATTTVDPTDTRIICPACDGSCWSRSARGRCLRCKGCGLIEPASKEADPAADPIPFVGVMPTVYRGPKPPHIGRAVLVAQRDVRALGGAKRSSRAISAQGEYSYSDAEEIISLGGDALLPLGVTATVLDAQPFIEPGPNGPVRRLAVTLQLEHPESGEVWEAPVRHVAVALDGEHTLSQAEYAATTSAFAYFLVHTLAMPRGYRTAIAPMLPVDDAPPAPAEVKPEQPRKSDTNAIVQDLAASVRATKSVAELDGVAMRVRRTFGRELKNQTAQRFLVGVIEEHRLVVAASDAHLAAEGPQTGRAA